MEPREAINLIKAKMEMHKAAFGKDVGEPLKSAYELAISALEKQESNCMESQTVSKHGKIDAEPKIIRCKDCKHWKTDHPTANRYHCCCRNHNIFPMGADDYCSFAERREDERPN